MSDSAASRVAPTPGGSLVEPPDVVVKAGFSKNLADADPQIQIAFPRVRLDWRNLHPDLDLKVDYTYRGPASQLELFKKGRAQDPNTGNWILVDRTKRVTDKDGTINLGEHNFYPSKAADVYIVCGTNILWPLPKDNPGYAARAALYVELGRLWERYGLVSGATWAFSWRDEPHVQIAATA